jgi:ribonuclease PH
MPWPRPDHRTPTQLRPITFQHHFTKHAPGSVLTKFGDTHVLCTVSIQEKVPRWLEGQGQGWLTAEYRMLPSATNTRSDREFMKLSGRTQEIQRLIGRSLRSTIDMQLLGERTLLIDADVLQADGGTRTAAITGSYIALKDALDKLFQQGLIEQSPLIHQVAAISVGLIEGDPYLDLNYIEDVKADIDFNIVMNESGGIIEAQGTAEAGSFSRSQLNRIMDVGEAGIRELFTLQNQS